MSRIRNLLVQSLQEYEHNASIVGEEVHLSSGWILRPEHIETQRSEDNQAVRTASIIHARHPLFFPEGLFEYQHAWGTDETSSLSNGFSTWVQTDLVVLEDALLDDPQHCMMMQMSFEDGRTPRQILFGPVTHYRSQQDNPPPATDADEHEFCPCCLFTRSIDAFKSLLLSQEPHGLRLYALRDNDDQASADCRVNGEEHPAGTEALVGYVHTWPQCGFEYRKQYVLIRNAPRNEVSSE